MKKTFRSVFHRFFGFLKNFFLIGKSFFFLEIFENNEKSVLFFLLGNCREKKTKKLKNEKRAAFGPDLPLTSEMIFSSIRSTAFCDTLNGNSSALQFTQKKVQSEPV